MAGLKFKKTLSGHNTAGHERFIAKNSTTITKGDPVYLEAGYADLAAAGEPIIGVANETVTGDGTATIEVIVDPLAVYEVTSTAFTLTNASKYVDIAGTTGAVVANTSSLATTDGQLLVMKYTDATHVDVVISEHQMLHPVYADVDHTHA